MSGCHAPYVMGNVAFNTPSLSGYCTCPCHSPTWMSVYPPSCWCSCHRTVTVTSTNGTATIFSIENKKMEEKIRVLEERIEKVEQWKKTAKILCDQSKKPHKCPICEGKGSTSLKVLTDGTPFIVMPCSSCEGKGIVWG